MELIVVVTRPANTGVAPRGYRGRPQSRHRTAAALIDSPSEHGRHRPGSNAEPSTMSEARRLVVCSQFVALGDNVCVVLKMVKVGVVPERVRDLTDRM